MFIQNDLNGLTGCLLALEKLEKLEKLESQGKVREFFLNLKITGKTGKSPRFVTGCILGQGKNEKNCKKLEKTGKSVKIVKYLFSFS